MTLVNPYIMALSNLLEDRIYNLYLNDEHGRTDELEFLADELVAAGAKVYIFPISGCNALHVGTSEYLGNSEIIRMFNSGIADYSACSV